jgi:hypothetical protein
MSLESLENIKTLKEGFQEMVMEVWPLLETASKRGIPIDSEERDKLTNYLEIEKIKLYTDIQSKVVDEIRKLHPPNGYLRVPPIVGELYRYYKENVDRVEIPDGKKLIDVDKYIEKKSRREIYKEGVGVGTFERIRLAKFEVISKELVKSEESRWVWVQDFNPNSSKQIIRYMKWKGHKVPVKLTGEETSDAKELERLAISTGDIFYDGIIEYRQINKMLTNDIPNWSPHEKTGAVHTEFSFFPATGQLSSRNPNVQNCFSGDTELLTDSGFVRFDGRDGRGGFGWLRQLGGRVAQYNPETGVINFVIPDNIIEQEYKGEMRWIHTQEQIDLCVTPDHECLLQNRKTKQIFKVPASKYRKDALQIHAGQYMGGDTFYTDAQIALICALQADGTVNSSGGIRWGLIKERKQQRLAWAMKEEGIRYQLSETSSKINEVGYYVGKDNVPEWLKGKKLFGEWILSLDQCTFTKMANEVFFWDGCWTRKNNYSSSIKSNADWVQVLMILTGKRGRIRKYHNDNPNSVDTWQVDVTRKACSGTANHINEKIECIEGRVYCVEVPTHNIIVRRNNVVCITGNCNKHKPLGKRFRKIIRARNYQWIRGGWVRI